MSIDQHIIAIGGGGFGRNPKHNKIEYYILEQVNKNQPNILFIPTASGEDKNYIINFYSCFSKLECNPDHISFFQRTPRLDSLINKADIIFKSKIVKKVSLKLEKLDIIKNTESVGIEVSKRRDE